MKNRFYVPILKSKLGEFTALSKLNDLDKEKTFPLFEITPLEWDQTERKVPKTLFEHLDSFCKKIIQKWPSNNCFIDSGLLYYKEEDNRKHIQYVFDKLNEKNICPIPIITLSASNEFTNAILNIKSKYPISDIGIRVSPNDVTAIDFNDKIVNTLDTLGIIPTGCHIIFDLADANYNDIENFSDAVLDILQAFPFLDQWKSMTIAGTSFPSSRIIKEGKTEYLRNEWKFYQLLLKKSNIKRQINFGDYSIVNPSYFEFNPKIMKASANIRYTHDEKWIVVKGKALKESITYKQYFKLAEQIFDSGYFLGEYFSQGDLYLAKCKSREEGPGSPSVWNWVGNNHHFVKVLFDLFSTSPGFSDN